VLTAARPFSNGGSPGLHHTEARSKERSPRGPRVDREQEPLALEPLLLEPLVERPRGPLAEEQAAAGREQRLLRLTAATKEPPTEEEREAEQRPEELEEGEELERLGVTTKSGPVYSSLVAERGRAEWTAALLTIQECQRLLQLFGLPWLMAPTEAEAQCAFLDMAGLTQGTIRDDSDIWLYGGKKVYRNFFNIQPRRPPRS
jgi:hypothetical protein